LTLSRARQYLQFYVDEASDLLVEGFISWSRQPLALWLRSTNWTTGEMRDLFVEASKRGNWLYRQRQQDRVDDLNEAMKGRTFSTSPKGSREGELYQTQLLLMTLTVATGELSRHEAWSSLPGYINRFRSHLTRRLGPHSALTVREGTANGYPAPHMIVLLDRPIPVKKHRSIDGKITYRLMSYREKQDLGEGWPLGNIDVEGIISRGDELESSHGSPIQYITKYLTKSVNELPDSLYPLKELAGGELTHLYTLAMNWAYRYHSFDISGELRERLRAIQSRLDTGICKVKFQLDLSMEAHPLWTYEMMGFVASRVCIDCCKGEGKPPPGCRSYFLRT